jgi:lipopolysaccharide transport protein LptA/LPS export ABC transporter protein LptC
MATASNRDQPTNGRRATGSGIVTGIDRTNGIGNARRHTLRVRILRYALPLTSLVLIGYYASTFMKAAGIGANLPQISIPRIIPEELAMANPHYEGFGKDGSSYVLDSKTAQQDLTTPTQIKLNEITGTLLQADKTKTVLTATRGDFNSKSSVLELYEKIDVVSESGMKAQLTRATLNTKDNTMVTQEPVAVEFSGGSVRANSMTLRHKAREVAFVDSVVARMVPQKPASTNAAVAAVAAATRGPQMFEASDAPLDITSSRLDIKDTVKTAVFTGNVKAVQNDQTLLTPELTVTYDGDALSTKAATPAAAGTEAATGKIRRIVAKGPVVMERGPLDKVTADSMDFDAPAQTGTLLGNVVMKSGADRQATSDRADLNQAETTILLTGRVAVVQGQNLLNGGRLFIDRKAGKALLTSPAADGAGPGRITARLVQGEGKDKSKAKKTEKPDASENPNPLSPAGSFKTDPNAPVDIEASQLDINDAQKTAVFRGDVKAVQGDFVIKTPELVANYTGEMNMADISGTEGAKTPGAKKASTELTTIRANTKVNVTSKDGQSVDGDWAVYDAKANTVVVGGEVVLSKGGSMVRGTRLLIDTVSGESTIETAPGKAIAQPGGGGWSTAAPVEGEATNRGRPSAVFFPGELRQSADGKKESKKDKDKAEKASTPAPAGGAWKAETAPIGAPNN